MDHFMEEVVTKKNHVVDDIMYVLSVIIKVLSAIVAVWWLNIIINAIASGIGIVSLLPDIVFALVMAAVAVLLFLFRDRLRTEYEYTFTNGDMDFAQVFNNVKRKSLGTLRVHGVEAFGRVNSSAFQRYISMPGVQQSRWFLNRGAELYFFYYQKDSNKRIIVCEPSEEMVQMIRQYLPHGAWQE